MTDHNKYRINAIKKIDEMYKDGKTPQQIIFVVDSLYGFSEKMVIRRIEQIKALAKE